MDSQETQKIAIPKSAQAKKSEEKYRIRVMPKEFLGKDSSLSVQKKEVEKPVPPPPPPPPKPVEKKPQVKAPVVPKKKKSKLPIFLGIFGLLFLLLIAAGAYVLLQSIQEDDPIDEPPPIVDETPEDEDQTDDEEPVVEIRPGVDTDSDGLTDREEALYGTDARNPDSDGDSFNDGNEVFHRFDPNGYAPSTLLDTGAVVEYIDDSYRLTYPRTWNLSLAEDGITMRSTTSANIIFIDEVEDVTVADLSAFARTQTKQGYDLYSSTDERTSYVGVGDELFEFVYDLNGSLTIDYVTTFQMIVNSFVLIEESA